MKASLILGFLFALLPGVTLANRLEVDDKDAGKDLLLGRGDHLRVTLPANPSTGYSWSVSDSPPGLLKQMGEPRFESATSRHGMVGAGGLQCWEFRAVGVGKMTLNFTYSRAWEHGSQPAREITWPVTIRK